MHRQRPTKLFRRVPIFIEWVENSATLRNPYANAPVFDRVLWIDTSVTLSGALQLLLDLPSLNNIRHSNGFCCNH